jgi:ferredoxin-NADP reductase
VLNPGATDDRGSDRWFTIASASHEGQVRLTTRFASQKGSTFKKALKALKEGDAIEISDLDGDFLLSDLDTEYVFIAGGIGITPFRAMLVHAVGAGKPLRATLLYANRDEVAAYKEEFEVMAARNPNFKIHYLLVRSGLIKRRLKNWCRT